MIRRLFNGRGGAPGASPVAGPAARRARRRRPALEALEGRALLSFSGPAQLISTNFPPTDDTDSDNASSANGTSVAVWVNAFSPTDHDIWAQRFDNLGHPDGLPIMVDASSDDSYHPRVAMDSQGRFVVTWEDHNSNGSSSIWMSYYAASDIPPTGAVLVSDVRLGDVNLDVAASDGSFVITWGPRGSGMSDIMAERFAFAGGFPQGQGIFTVKAATSLQGDPSVAMAPDGRFVIAYDQVEDGDNRFVFDIFASQYDAGGHLVRGNIPINTDPASFTYSPSVAMDAAGNAVVAYERQYTGGIGVYANRLSSGGAVGGMITVQDSSDDESEASVALAPTGGRFVVSYAVVRGGVLEHQVTEMASDNTPLATLGPVDVTTDEASAISVDGLDRFFMTEDVLDGSGHENVYGHRDVLGGEDLVSALPPAAGNYNSQADTASSANGTSVVVWDTTLSFTNHDIWAQRYDRDGRPAGAPIAVDTLTTDDSVTPHVAMDSQGRFVVAWDNRNPDGTFSVMTRYYSAAGAPLTGIIRVTPAGSNDTQPDVAASDGSFVITWTHQVSTTNDDIQAERFALPGGVPQGQGIFTVIADTSIEDAPSVAMAPDGRFDIAYERQWFGADWDIFAAQYGSTGALVRGGVFINFDSNPEHSPSIAMDAAGNAVVAYQEFIGIQSEINANRLSSAGSVGPMILAVSLDVGNNPSNPSVALSPSGGSFVVAYDSALRSGVSTGVRAVEVAADDTVRGFGFPPTVGPLDGFSPAVSIDGFGRYVLTYARSVPATNRVDIFSRRFFLT
jgi:hypothetical protein